MERGDELYGEGNEYTTEHRQYDSRLGRWMSLDPEMATYPGISPYNFSFNNPVFVIDPDGDDPLKDHDGPAQDGNNTPEDKDVFASKSPQGNTPPDLNNLNLTGKGESLISKIGKYLNSLPLFVARKSYDVVPTDERKARASSQKDFYKVYSLYKNLNYQVKYDMLSEPDEMIVSDPKNGGIIDRTGIVKGRGAINIPGGTNVIRLDIVANRSGQTGFNFQVVSTEKSIVQTTRIYFLGVIPVSRASVIKRPTGQSDPVVPKRDSYWLSAYERRRLGL